MEIDHIRHGPVEISTGVEISAKMFLQDDDPHPEKHFWSLFCYLIPRRTHSKAKNRSLGKLAIIALKR